MASYSFRSVLFACMLIVCPLTVFGVVDIYQFDTESQRLRYHQLIEELRCPKCQNQNLAGSDSEIASDLRRELYRLLTEGKTDREIKSFMVDRYGDFVLYKPRLQKSTLVLWLLPIALFIMGIGIIFVVVRRRKHDQQQSVSRELSDNEQQALKTILSQKHSDPIDK